MKWRQVSHFLEVNEKAKSDRILPAQVLIGRYQVINHGTPFYSGPASHSWLSY